MSEMQAPSYPPMNSGQQPQSHYMGDAQSAHTNLVSKSYYQEEGGMTSHPESQHYMQKSQMPQQYIEMAEMQSRKANNQSNPRQPQHQQHL
mmetsp:Transcript_21052/g.32589  ORF Transcript_21052/g.32589 Transcript_21052/m.32589 type:complete len:91 (-) Transcript_21052:3090-3362(-)